MSAAQAGLFLLQTVNNRTQSTVVKERLTVWWQTSACLTWKLSAAWFMVFEQCWDGKPECWRCLLLLFGLGISCLSRTANILGARCAFEIFQVFHVCVFGPRADADQTFSSEAWVHASSLPRLIEPNPLLIFPQRAVSPPDFWCDALSAITAN